MNLQRSPHCWLAGNTDMCILPFVADAVPRPSELHGPSVPVHAHREHPCAEAEVQPGPDRCSGIVMQDLDVGCDQHGLFSIDVIGLGHLTSWHSFRRRLCLCPWCPCSLRWWMWRWLRLRLWLRSLRLRLRWLWCPPSPLLLLLWNRGIGYSHPSRHMVCRWCWRYLTVPETKDAFPLVRRHLHAHLSSTGLGL